MRTPPYGTHPPYPCWKLFWFADRVHRFKTASWNETFLIVFNMSIEQKMSGGIQAMDGVVKWR